MSGRKQHVDLYRKLLLRKRLCSQAQPGAACVPFISDGDIASKLYADRKIYGADINRQRVATAQSRLPGATIRTADCSNWPFPNIEDQFAVADFDAYCNPHPSLIAFWKRARKARRIVLFGTDGLRQRIARAEVVKELPAGSETPSEGQDHRRQYNLSWIKHVVPFIARTITPHQIMTKASYTRKGMLYWGIVASVS